MATIRAAAVAAKPKPSTKALPTPAAKKAVAKAPVKKIASAAPKAPAAIKPATEKMTKPKKQKMVRDSMNIPKVEYAVLEILKLRAAKLASPAKKTELIRAGIKALAAMSDTAFLAALRNVPSLKTGRPAKDL